MPFIAMIKMKGCIEKSVDIMSSLNQLVNVREIQGTMMDMAREMERAGLVDEIIVDAMESMDDEGVNAEADLEVDKIITELTAGVLAPAGSAPVRAPPAKQAAAPVESTATAAAAEEEGPTPEELMARLQAL